MVSIDHFFVFAKPGAPEQQRLIESGVSVGMQRDHPGQGTRNVCFSFADCYLELLWIDDEQDTQSATSKPLRLFERSNWRETQASPFGLCLRGNHETPPFAHWDYRPAYIPEHVTIQVARGSDASEEPMLFQIDRVFEAFGETHALSKFALHRVVLTTPTLPPTSHLLALDVARLEVVQGDEHLMTVTLRNGNTPVGEQQLDLRPELPLVLRW